MVLTLRPEIEQKTASILLCEVGVARRLRKHFSETIKPLIPPETQELSTECGVFLRIEPVRPPFESSAEPVRDLGMSCASDPIRRGHVR